MNQTNQRNRTLHYLLASLLSIGLLGQSTLAAAADSGSDSNQTAQATASTGSVDDSADGSSTTPASEKANANGKGKNQKSSSKDNNDRGFIPSEEISEDFAVSFPVDI